MLLPKYIHYIPYKGKKYKVCIYRQGNTQKYLGYYATVQEALVARDDYCRKHNIIVKEYDE